MSVLLEDGIEASMLMVALTRGKPLFSDRFLFIHIRGHILPKWSTQISEDGHYISQE